MGLSLYASRHAAKWHHPSEVKQQNPPLAAMSPDDETELHRLADMLRAIDDELDADSPFHEALKRAGLALSYGFIAGQRAKIEDTFAHLAKKTSMP